MLGDKRYQVISGRSVRLDRPGQPAFILSAFLRGDGVDMFDGDRVALEDIGDVDVETVLGPAAAKQGDSLSVFVR